MSSSSENIPFICHRYGVLLVPRPGHFPCPEMDQVDGAADNADVRSTMCYCSVTVLIQEQQQPTSTPSESEVAYFEARSSVDEHFAVEAPTSSGDEARRGVHTPAGDEARRDNPEPPLTPTATRGHTHAADDTLSPPWAPRRRRTGPILSEPIFPWDLGSPTHPSSRARRTEGRNRHTRFPSTPSPTESQRDGARWRPYREWNRDGAAMAAWASQQHQSLPRFSPPARPLSPGEGPSGLGRRATAVRRREEAARGPNYPDHAAFIGSAGAQDNGPYPAPPPRPQQGPPPRSHHHHQQPSRFARPRMTRWPTPQPRRPRLDLEITYCPAQHAPGAVASTRTYYPEHTGPATLHSSSTNSGTHQNDGCPTSAHGGNNNGGSNNDAAANRHLNASSASPPSSSPKEQASESPDSSPPRHVFQAELNFVQPDDAVFSMAAATHPAPPAPHLQRRLKFWQRVRNVVRAPWRRRRSRGSAEQAHPVMGQAEGYEAGDEDSLAHVPMVPKHEDGDEGADSEGWSEVGQPADSDSGVMVDIGEDEAGPSVVREAVRSKERFSMD